MKVVLGILFIMVLTIVLLLVCEEDKSVKPEISIVSGITRVLIHGPGNFTFLVQNSDKKKLSQLSIETYITQVEILNDLSVNEPIRIEYFCGFEREFPRQCRPIPPSFSYWRLQASQLTIHLHSAEEIVGAGWGRGKYGKGQTIVVE